MWFRVCFRIVKGFIMLVVVLFVKSGKLIFVIFIVVFIVVLVVFFMIVGLGNVM